MQGGDRGGGGGTWGELAVGSTEKTREETAQVLSRRAAFVNTASGGEWQTHTLAFDPLQDSDPGQPLHSLLQPGMQVCFLDCALESPTILCGIKSNIQRHSFAIRTWLLKRLGVDSAGLMMFLCLVAGGPCA